MQTTMWLEGLGDAFLINGFLLGGKGGMNAMPSSYGLCKFDGSCAADIDVRRSPDRISGKLFQAAATDKNFPTGKVSMIYRSDSRSYRTYSVYLVNARVMAIRQRDGSEESIFFICSDLAIDFG